MKPRSNQHAALRLPRRNLVPAILAISLSGGAILSAAEVTYKYYRFTPTNNNPTTQTQIQMSEFSFTHFGKRLSLAGVTAAGGASTPDSGEGALKLIDGSLTTKWFNNGRAPVVFTFPNPVTIDRYNFATANDSLDRTPYSWTLEGSADGITYTLIDTRTNVAAPTTLFTWLQSFEVGGNAALSGITFTPTTTRISADGVTPQVFTAAPAIVKNGQSVSVTWGVTGTPTAITLDGATIAATGTQTITPAADSVVDHKLAATTAAGESDVTLRIRSVPGASITTQYLRFTPSRLRGLVGAIQLGEFEFYNGSTEVQPFAVTNPGGRYPGGEQLPRLTDGDFTTKYLDHNAMPLIFDFGSVQTIDGYQFVTGNDAPERDPVSWSIETSADGVHWTLVDQVQQYPTPTTRYTATGILPLSGEVNTWTGSASADWDATATNFVAQGSSTPIAYAEGDIVRFPEGAANPAVNLPAALSPLAVEINAATTAYSFAGAGLTGTASVRKQGAATASLDMASSFTGPIVVGGGKLVGTVDGAFGARDTQAPIDLLSGGTLEAGVSMTVQRKLRVYPNGGTIAAAEGATLTKTGPFELSTTLTKAGLGTVLLNSYANSIGQRASGEWQFVVNEGMLDFGAGYYNSFPLQNSLPVSILVNADGTLRFSGNGPFGGHHTLTNNFIEQYKILGRFQIDSSLNYIPLGKTAEGEGRLTLQGGIVTGNGYFEPVVGSEALGNSTVSVLASEFPSEIAGGGGMALNPGNITIITDTGATLVISKQITGAYGFRKEGAGEIVLTNGSNTYRGEATAWETGNPTGTNITAGTLTLQNFDGNATSTSRTTIATGAKLQGSGYGLGPLVAAGTVAPGDADFPVAKLTVGTTQLTGTLNVEIDGAEYDQLAVVDGPVVGETPGVVGDVNITGATLNVTTLPGGFTEDSYPILTYTGTLTGTFASVTGVPSGYSVIYNAAAKRVEISNGTAPTGYAGWAQGLSDPSPEADIDHDGLSNAVEFVLGTSATTPSLANAPTSSYDASGNLVFTFRRSTESAYLNPGVEYSTTLADGSWTTAPAASVVVTPGPTGFDTVTVTLPSSLAASGKLFARLKVVVTP